MKDVEELVARYRATYDESILEEILRTFMPGLRRFVRNMKPSYLNRRVGTSDVLQDVGMGVKRILDDVNCPISSLWGLVRQVGANTLTNYIRRETAERRSVNKDVQIQDALDLSHRDTFDLDVLWDLKDFVQAELETAEGIYSEILELGLVQGLTATEIHEQLVKTHACPPALRTIQVKLQSARARIKGRFIVAGYDLLE